MKPIVFSFIIACSYFLVGCDVQNKDSLVRYSSFGEVVSLKSEKIEVPPVLLYPRGVYLSNNHLVVLNEKTDTLFQVFDLPGMEYCGQFGIKGGGPNDFMLPLIQPVYCDEKGFVLSDGDKLKQVGFEGNGMNVLTMTLPFGFPFYNGLQRLTDSLYCCFAGFEDEQPLMLLKPDGKTKNIGGFPEDVSPRFKDALARNQAYAGLLISNPEQARMALFYQHVRRWRIYDEKGTIVSDNWLDMQPGQFLPKVEDEERYIHTIAVYATRKYIYTLNLDMTVREISGQVRNPNIQVFDWDGCPLKQYNLDCFISSFTVNEETSEIFGTFVEDMNHVYLFKMK